MDALGLQPNTYTFNALIACCARALGDALRGGRGGVARADSRDGGLGRDSGVLAEGGAAHAHMADAFGAFDEMQRRGLPPDNFTFSALINACAKARELLRPPLHRPRRSSHAAFSRRSSRHELPRPPPISRRASSSGCWSCERRCRLTASSPTSPRSPRSSTAARVRGGSRTRTP